MAEPLPDIAPCPAPLPEPLPDALVGPGALPGLGPPPLLLDASDGVHVLGPATVDSDADGHPDTAVVAAAGLDPAGSAPEHDALLLGTDLDADGHVDVASTIAADGRAGTATRGADGRFAPGWDGDGREGHADVDPGPATDAAWTGEGNAAAPPAPSIDPVTGTWTRWTGTP